MSRIFRHARIVFQVVAIRNEIVQTTNPATNDAINLRRTPKKGYRILFTIVIKKRDVTYLDSVYVVFDMLVLMEKMV